jgi:hypothetical protein
MMVEFVMSIEEARRRVEANDANRTRSPNQSHGHHRKIEKILLELMRPGKVYPIKELKTFVMAVLGKSDGSVGPATSYMVDVSKTVFRPSRGWYQLTDKGKKKDVHID